MSVLNKITVSKTYNIKSSDLNCHYGTVLNGDDFEEFRIPGTDNLYYDIEIYPNGTTAEDRYYFAVMVGMNAPVKASLCFKVEKTRKAILKKIKVEFKHKMTRRFMSSKNYHGVKRLFNHDAIEKLFPERSSFEFKLTVQIQVHARVLPPTTGPVVDVVSKLVCPDMFIVVGGLRFPAHRALMASLSPMFENVVGAKQASFKLIIQDRDAPYFETVMRLCYGYKVINLPTSDAIGAMKLAKNCQFRSIFDQLEKHIVENITIHNFYTVLDGTLFSMSLPILEACANFYRDNKRRVEKHPFFIHHEDVREDMRKYFGPSEAPKIESVPKNVD